MKILWTFENQTKLDAFAIILKKNDIEYETGKQNKTSGEITIAVEEKNYVKAKKLLMKHRKRRTSADYK